MTKMRVLTLWQPWASLVIAGAKPFEFRGARPPRTIVGERVVIHAAKREVDIPEAAAMWRALTNGHTAARELCLKRDRAVDVLADAHLLPRGCGLGTAVVGEARDGIEIAREEFGAEHVEVGELESNWGWPLTQIERWAAPIPARGKQGIWFWPHDLPQGEPVS